MRQELVIPGWVPPNVANAGAAHPMAKHKQTKITKQTVWAYAKHAGWKKIHTRGRLTVTFVFSVKRTRDVDNLAMRAKALVDGLKPFFVDDSPEWLERPVPTVEVRKGVLETRVVLESL